MIGFWDGSGISWTVCKQSAPRFRHTATPAPCHSIFTGRMLFVMSVNVSATSVNALKANSILFEQRDKSSPVNSTHYVMFYHVQHDDRIVTISSLMSHAPCIYSRHVQCKVCCCQ